MRNSEAQLWSDTFRVQVTTYFKMVSTVYTEMKWSTSYAKRNGLGRKKPIVRELCFMLSKPLLQTAGSKRA